MNGIIHIVGADRSQWWIDGEDVKTVCQEGLIDRYAGRGAKVVYKNGGIGEFVPEGFRNRFYVQWRGMDCCTMRFRPEYSAEEVEALGTRNRFFHPMKNEFCE